MASVNKCILIGNLGRDPELRFTKDGRPVANFTLATNERWRDKEGNNQERTEWHRIVVWDKSAENCAQYLAKGRSAYVKGRLKTREWDDQGRQQAQDHRGRAPAGHLLRFSQQGAAATKQGQGPAPARWHAQAAVALRLALPVAEKISRSDWS